MLNKFFVALVCCLFVVNLACQSADTTSKNANAVSNSADSANMPPGFSASPVTVTGNSTPGIPAANANLPKGTTPTPGIPDSTKGSAPPSPKGATTPGIPDQQTLKKQMNTPIDPSVVNNPSKDNKQSRENPPQKSKIVPKP